MALDRDELNRRRKAGEARRQRQRRMMTLRLVAVLAVLLAAAVGMLWLVRDSGGAPAGPTEPHLQTTQPTGETQPEEPSETQPEDPTETEPESPAETEPEASGESETAPPETDAPAGPEKDEDAATTVIHLAAAGDLNINDTTVAAGMTGGGYDYTEVFKDVAPVFAGADLALLNFEGNLVGAPYGSRTLSAPQELARALRAMGVDLVQAANSCSVTHGVAGLAQTLDNIRGAGLEPLGAFANAEDFQRTKGYTIVEVQGIRIALVAFTKGVGGLSLPAGSEDCVNLLYTDYATTYQKIDKEGINRILTNVATEKPDLTIALVHWGSEYKDMVTPNQEKIADIMLDGGVDVILGTHPHMLHRIDFDPVSGQMVAYSLGDFYGEAERAGTNYSIILELEITKDHASGATRVTDYTYTPIFTLTEDTSPDGQHRVVRLRQAISAYEMNFVGKVSESVYNSMTYARGRIAARINPQPEQE